MFHVKFNITSNASGVEFKQELWEKAFSEVKWYFEIESLLPEQKEAIRGFFSAKNVFANLPTGYGKSLIREFRINGG